MLEAASGKSGAAFFASTVFSLVVLCEIVMNLSDTNKRIMLILV